MVFACVSLYVILVWSCVGKRHPSATYELLWQLILSLPHISMGAEDAEEDGMPVCHQGDVVLQIARTETAK